MPAAGNEDNSNSLTYLITKKPDIGRLLIQGEEVHLLSGAQFTHAQLQSGQVVYAAGNGETDSLPSGQQQPTETIIRLKACQRVCSDEATMTIHIEADNLQGLSSFYYRQ
jgi:hypothetical protein